jgi:uncharacterized protein YmfQ (DUF2313 family)
MRDTCEGFAPVNMPCPVPYDTIVQAACAKFPRGWAWDSAAIPGTNLHSLVRAWSWMIHDVTSKACDLLPEFRCHTVDQTLDDWYADYGLPDACGINDLCAKLAAVGGQDCGYYSDVAAMLGYVDTCCEEIAPEIMAGCWNLGCQQMPPQPVFTKGGSLLGYAMLACPIDDCGSDLGQGIHGPEDCMIAGYVECEPVPALDGSVCRNDTGCLEYVPPSVGVLLTGCYAPYELDYTGTAYHWRFGTPDTQAHLLGKGGDPASCVLNDGLSDDWGMGFTPLGTFYPGTPPTPGQFAIMGCWETGCTPLCSPDPSSLLCFINALKPAHTVAASYWCEEH